jgi:hypothetical protein
MLWSPHPIHDELRSNLARRMCPFDPSAGKYLTRKHDRHRCRDRDGANVHRGLRLRVPPPMRDGMHNRAFVEWPSGCQELSHPQVWARLEVRPRELRR